MSCELARAELTSQLNCIKCCLAMWLGLWCCLEGRNMEKITASETKPEISVHSEPQLDLSHRIVKLFRLESARVTDFLRALVTYILTNLIV